MSKRITLAVHLTVSVTVDAEDRGGEIDVVRVVCVNGLPTAKDVMEALDAEDDFEQLDKAYENANGDAS